MALVRELVHEEVIRLRQNQGRLNARLNEIKSPPPTLAEQRDIVAARDRADPVYCDLEMRGSPDPAGNESPADYRRRLAAGLQCFSQDWRDTDLYRIPASELAPIESMIYLDAAAVAADPTQGSFRNPGQLREIVTTTEAGHQIKSFAGDPAVWMSAFMTPRIFVKAFIDHRTGLPVRYGTSSI